MQRHTVNRGPVVPPRLEAREGGPLATSSGRGSRESASGEREGHSRQEGEQGLGGGVYVISVAARLLGMHPQTLRKYERLGLVRPTRSLGMLRLYSAEDVVRVRMIKYMVDSLGMNLAGVEFVLNFLTRIEGMRERLRAMSQAEASHELVARELEEMLAELRAIFPESPRAV